MEYLRHGSVGISILGVLVIGFVFSIPFALVGAGKIDSHAAQGTWGFRVLIVPGTILLWPLLARRWSAGLHEPPEENSPHRRAALRPSP